MTKYLVEQNRCSRANILGVERSRHATPRVFVLTWVETWGGKGGFALAEPPSLFGGGDSQSTHLRRYLVFSRHHVSGVWMTSDRHDLRR